MATPTPADPNTPYTDPTSTSLNLACLDFLLIELVPMAYRITNDLALREEEWIHGPHNPTSSTSTIKPRPASDIADSNSTAGTIGGGGGGGEAPTVDEEEAREAVFHRLESLGYRVGLGVVERFSRTSPRPTSPLDIIKFLCKDLWTLLFRKQIDNLKTNHRGIYVLTDNSFKPLSRVSFDTKKFPNAVNNDGTIGESTSLARVQPFLYFPAGVIRGCLAALGIQASVQAECTALPAATFQIRTVGAKN